MRIPAVLAVLALAAGPAAADTALPGGITQRTDSAGVTYADAHDMTLYTYAQDKPGKSACYNACAKAWPPLSAPADASAVGAWEPIPRDDGGRQWALNGQPLYTYSKDMPGTAFGDGLANFAWRPAFEPIFTPPGITVRANALGRLITNQAGMTLYHRADGKTCDGKCLEEWEPVSAPHAATDKGDWTIQQRRDGTRQWAFQGKPLYRYLGDIRPGDNTGVGRDKTWQAAVLAATPPAPSWVTVQATDLGEVYANEKGLTLYVGPADLDRVKKIMCDDACIAKSWTFVTAPPDAKPSGHWSITKDPEGKPVWAYRGNPVYIHLRDRAPGDIGGDKWAAGSGGGGGGWQAIVPLRGLDEPS
jgi:predicted lipoprotein with Yx(FWY)xxD motif